MNTNALLKHIGIAIALSILAIIGDTLLTPFLTKLLTNRLNISAIVFLYLSLLIQQSDLTTGKVTLFTINLAVLFTSLLSVEQLPALLGIYLIMIWLSRSLLNYTSLLTSIADFSLCVLSASIVYWLLLHGHSSITALWCFLLLQALHALLPKKDRPLPKSDGSISKNNFNQALQSAESALQQLLKKEA